MHCQNLNYIYKYKIRGMSRRFPERLLKTYDNEKDEEVYETKKNAKTAYNLTINTFREQNRIMPGKSSNLTDFTIYVFTNLAIILRSSQAIIFCYSSKNLKLIKSSIEH